VDEYLEFWVVKRNLDSCKLREVWIEANGMCSLVDRDNGIHALDCEIPNSIANRRFINAATMRIPIFLSSKHRNIVTSPAVVSIPLVSLLNSSHAYHPFPKRKKTK
jgi:hypothetical protein